MCLQLEDFTVDSTSLPDLRLICTQSYTQTAWVLYARRWQVPEAVELQAAFANNFLVLSIHNPVSEAIQMDRLRLWFVDPAKLFSRMWLPPSEVRCTTVDKLQASALPSSGENRCDFRSG